MNKSINFFEYFDNLVKNSQLPGQKSKNFSSIQDPKNENFPVIELRCHLCQGHCIDFEFDSDINDLLCCCCYYCKDWCDLCQKRQSPNHCFSCGSEDLEIRLVLETFLEYGNFFYYASIRIRLVHEIYYCCNSCNETNKDIQMMELITP